MSTFLDKQGLKLPFQNYESSSRYYLLPVSWPLSKYFEKCEFYLQELIPNQKANVSFRSSKCGNSTSRCKTSKSISWGSTYAKVFAKLLKPNMISIFLIQKWQNEIPSWKHKLASQKSVNETHQEWFSKGWTSTSTFAISIFTSAIFTFTTPKTDICFLVRNEPGVATKEMIWYCLLRVSAHWAKLLQNENPYLQEITAQFKPNLW